MTATTQSCDIVIAGGGIAGLTLACLLADTDFSVVLIERNVLSEKAEQTDLRVSAIGRAAMAVFQQCKAWDAMLQDRATAFSDMHVWDSTGAGEIHFDSAELGLDALGYIIENNRIQHALLEQVEAADNIELLCPASIESIQLADSRLVTLDDGNSIECRLLVGADGVNSKIRDVANIDMHTVTYGQKALVCAVDTEYSHRHTAWQIFLPQGPLAFLPLHQDQCSIVWSLPAEQAEQYVAMDESEFTEALQQAFEYKLGAVTLTTARAAFPLQHGHVDQYIQDGLALVGDAAHIIHPLAGQGANLGILDVSELSQILLDARHEKRHWWAQHTLRAYERHRKGENRIMENAMTGFNQLFSNDNAWLSMLRNAGLNMVDHAPFIKQQFMQHAMGVRR